MKLLRIGMIVLLALLCIPRVVHAGSQEKVYFYERELNGEVTESGHEIDFSKDCPLEIKARVLFYVLVNHTQEGEFTFIPPNTKLIDVKIQENSVLVLELSDEIENFGGNEWEKLFLNQIKKTAYSMDEISSILILVNGHEANLPEGTEYTAIMEE